MPKPTLKDDEIYSTKFGKLLVLNIYSTRNVNTGRKERRCFCLCDCGEYFNGTKGKIVRGVTRSCGCLQKECRESWKSKMIAKKDLTDATSFNEKYQTYRRRAERSGISFTLTKKDFRDITSGYCHYCGEDSEHNKNETRRYEGRTYLCNGIDRVNSSLGYDVENCVSCCDVCNRMKMAHSVEFFKQHIIRIYLNLNY